MFETYAKALIDTLKSCDEAEWNEAIAIINETYLNDRQIITCGNGGSASTASHYITDWNKMTLHYNQRALRGICLSDNMGLVTAYANDYSYEDIFAEQLKFYAKENDLLIVISGSGNSSNILKALVRAKELSMKTLAIVGFSGGKAAELADAKVLAPIDDMQISEDLHLVFGHMVMKSLCQKAK